MKNEEGSKTTVKSQLKGLLKTNTKGGGRPLSKPEIGNRPGRWGGPNRAEGGREVGRKTCSTIFGAFPELKVGEARKEKSEEEKLMESVSNNQRQKILLTREIRSLLHLV